MAHDDIRCDAHENPWPNAQERADQPGMHRMPELHNLCFFVCWFSCAVNKFVMLFLLVMCSVISVFTVK